MRQSYLDALEKNIKPGDVVLYKPENQGTKYYQARLGVVLSGPMDHDYPAIYYEGHFYVKVEKLRDEDQYLFREGQTELDIYVSEEFLTVVGHES